MFSCVLSDVRVSMPQFLVWLVDRVTIISLLKDSVVKCF